MERSILKKPRLAFFFFILIFFHPTYVESQEALASETLAVVNFSKTPSTVTVPSFVPAESGKDAWLGKALSDLLIKHLSEVQSLTVLEREKMQVFDKEVGLGESALVGTERALRLGRVAKVDHVIYGSYVILGEKLQISVFVMDMGTQRVIQTEEAEGKLDDFQALVKKIAFQYLERRGRALSDEEKNKIWQIRSDSVGAAKHFYQGLDFYDRGHYADAWGEFFAAALEDTHHLEAQLWMGKMFEALGYSEQAVLTYRELYRKAPVTVEGIDALFFAARILAAKLGRQNEAVEAYSVIAEKRPMSPQVLEALFSSGQLLEEQKKYLEAYQRFETVDSTLDDMHRDPLSIIKSDLRASRFFSWPHALGLSKDVITRMISLYGLLNESLDEKELPKPPRGVFLVPLENPVIQEVSFKKSPSLFFEKLGNRRWNEEFYAVLVPKGYVATGAALHLTGSSYDPGPHHDFAMKLLPFPLPRGYETAWLGVIYGQTREETTLQKSISFFGENRKIFILQFVENSSTITSWQLDVQLKRDDEELPAKPPDNQAEEKNFWEGRPLGFLPLPAGRSKGVSRPYEIAFYFPKKEIAIASDAAGKFHMAGVDGELDGEETNLWVSESSDGRQWSKPGFPLFNSASDDTYPKLVVAEDGKLWLSWISLRRGKGWELWVAVRDRTGQWGPASRIPTEKVLQDRPANDYVRGRLLEYDLFQNRRGEWIVALYSTAAKKIYFFKSADGKEWPLTGELGLAERLFGLSLTEDASAIYRLSALGENGSLFLFSSKDGVSWTSKKFDRSVVNVSAAHVQSTRLFAEKDGQLLLLISDNIFGLQYARFFPNTDSPKFDLVRFAGLEAYAAAQTRDGETAVAFRQNEGVQIRRYKSFNDAGADVEDDKPDWPIYVEKEKDSDGNLWQRITARAKYIVPDMTALGVEPGGRVWWGIESGIMSKKGDEFFATDVSLGFVYHDVTDILCCGDGRVWLSSKDAKKAMLAVTQRSSGADIHSSGGFQSEIVTGLKGSITATACDTEKQSIFLGTSQGEIALYQAGKVLSYRQLKPASWVSAIAVSQATHELWVGTKNEGLFHSESSQGGLTKIKDFTEKEVTGLALDSEGALWVGLNGKGLKNFQKGRWQDFSPEYSGIYYSSIGNLKADPVRGVWFLAHSTTRSFGVVYFDGKSGRLFNPPHRLIEKPSSLDIDRDGNVWIGTSFDGVYKLERAREAA